MACIMVNKNLKPFLNCYIWVVGAYDYKNINGEKIYKLKKIFFYNSLTDRTFDNQNELSSYSFEIQIPEFVITGVTREISEMVIEGKIEFPLLKMVKGSWVLV